MADEYPDDVAHTSQELEVPAALAGQRFDQAVAQLFPQYSRSLLAKLIASGDLLLDGQTCKPRTRLKGGERVQLGRVQMVTEQWHTPQAMALDVIFEDESLLVLNKAPGVVVHPGAGNPSGTLVNALLAYRPQLAELPRAGIVHRLDKDTTGLMVVAATATSHHALVSQMADRTVQRRYLALATGVIARDFSIEAPIGRHPRTRTRQAVRHDGKSAKTDVRVIAGYPGYTLVQASLHTGRTHQIRVHLSHKGFPLVGDTTYGGAKQLPLSGGVELTFSRQALHAAELSFRHPESGHACDFAAPLPQDFAELLAALEALKDSEDSKGKEHS